MPRVFFHQPKDGHPPEESVLQTRNLALTPYSQNWHKVPTAIHRMVTTTSRMVTHQKEVHYRHGIYHLEFTHKTNTRWHLFSLLCLVQLSNQASNTFPVVAYLNIEVIPQLSLERDTKSILLSTKPKQNHTNHQLSHIFRENLIIMQNHNIERCRFCC